MVEATLAILRSQISIASPRSINSATEREIVMAIREPNVACCNCGVPYALEPDECAACGSQAFQLQHPAMTAPSKTTERGEEWLDTFNAGIDAAMATIDARRVSEAGMFDKEHSGQRGEDRSNALYDAYNLVKRLRRAQPPQPTGDDYSITLPWPEYLKLIEAMENPGPNPELAKLLRSKAPWEAKPESAQPTGAREAPASCPNCHDRTDCSNVDQCNAVERAYARPTGDVEGLVERLKKCRDSFSYNDGSLSSIGQLIHEAVLALFSANSRSERLVEMLLWIDRHDPEIVTHAEAKFGIDLRPPALSTVAGEEK